MLSSMLNYPNTVIVMTIVRPTAEKDLTVAEREIYKDKRMTKCMLFGLKVDLLSTFACQYLNVVGIPKELDRYSRSFGDLCR